MFIRSRSGRGAITPCPDTGQGLVEYALILVLVAVVVIAVLTLLGDEIGAVFCKITVSLGGDTSGNASCPAPVVNCIGGSNPEADVFDDKGTSNITSVDIYVNGTYWRSEYIYHYCIAGGNGPCAAYNPPPGTTVTAIATDSDGNTGQCSMSY